MSFSAAPTYNQGKLSTVTFSGNTGTNSLNYQVVYKYNSNGYLNRLEDASQNMLREINTVNAFGQQTSVGYGNGLTTQTAYTLSGVLSNIHTSNNIQNISYDAISPRKDGKTP